MRLRRACLWLLLAATLSAVAGDAPRADAAPDARAGASPAGDAPRADAAPDARAGGAAVCAPSFVPLGGKIWSHAVSVAVSCAAPGGEGDVYVSANGGPFVQLPPGKRLDGAYTRGPAEPLPGRSTARGEHSAHAPCGRAGARSGGGD